MPEEYEPISAFDRADDDWYDEGEEVYEDMLNQLMEDFPQEMSQEAADLLWDGWFSGEVSPIDRQFIRMEFFDLTGLDWDDFNWHDWREWYESV